MFSEQKRNNLLIVGAKQTTRAIFEDSLKEIYLAEDADKFVTKDIEKMAKEKNIKINYVSSMKKLGKDCDISVGTAVVGVKKFVHI